MSNTVLPGQKQPTASAWILTEETPHQVLLLHHRKLQVWLQPGGHVEPFEDFWEGMIREVQEETGIDLSALPVKEKIDDFTWEVRPPDYLQVQTIPAYGEQPEHFHVDSQYVVRIPKQKLVLQEAESADIGWFSLEDLAELKLFENTKVRLHELLAAQEGT